MIGATGMIGEPVAKTFLNAGYEITMLARNPDKARKMFGDEVRIVGGDLEKQTVLEELLNGQHWLYLNLSVAQDSKAGDFQPERDGLKNILVAAQKSNIKRIGYLSSLVQRYHGMEGFSWWGLEIRQQAVKTIRASGIPHTIFYPSNFMENFNKGSMMQAHKILLIGKSLYPFYWISGFDFGKQVVKSFESDEGNREYVIQGPEALSSEEAAIIFRDHYRGVKPAIVRIPYWIIKLAGTFSSKANYGANILYALNHYPEKFEAEESWQRLGKPEMTLKAYAQAYF